MDYFMLDTMSNMAFIPSSNNPDSPLSDVRVRKAIAYIIVRDVLATYLTYGFGMPSQQIFTYFQIEYDQTAVGYSYNPQLSRQYLVESGYPIGLDDTLEIMALDLPLALHAMLLEVGIILNIELMRWTPKFGQVVKVESCS